MNSRLPYYVECSLRKLDCILHRKCTFVLYLLNLEKKVSLLADIALLSRFGYSLLLRIRHVRSGLLV